MTIANKLKQAQEGRGGGMKEERQARELLSGGWIREVIIVLITGWAASLIRSQPTPDNAYSPVFCNVWNAHTEK